MLKRYLPFLLLFSIVVACSKDKLNTKPSIKIKSINGTEFVNNGPDLQITLTFDDKEGDLGNGTVTYIRDRLNIKPISDPGSNDKVDTVNTAIPDFPKTTTGEIKVIVPNTFLDKDPIDNDTMIFKIFVQDIAGNVSDTVSTPTIVQIQQ